MFSKFTELPRDQCGSISASKESSGDSEWDHESSGQWSSSALHTFRKTLDFTQGWIESYVMNEWIKTKYFSNINIKAIFWVLFHRKERKKIEPYFWDSSINY